MAIVQSIVRIYEDAQKQTLIGSVTKSTAPFDVVPVDSLDAGKAYFATAQVTDDSSLVSAESAVYQFYTLADCEWFSPPSAAGTTVNSQINGISEDLTISQLGIVYDTSSQFTNPIYIRQGQGGVDIHNLAEGTTYYMAPLVVDELNREWINWDETTNVTTGYNVATLAWNGVAAVGPTEWTHTINIQSTSPLTNVTVTYGEVGGSTSTFTLANTTGNQSVTLSGLTPNTSYTVQVSATNSGGTASSSVTTFTTMSATVTPVVSDVFVSGTDNRISARSNVTYDSNVVTIQSHDLELHTTSDHSTAATQILYGGSVATYTNSFSHANDDTQYYVFSKVTYTVTGDASTYTAWSNGISCHTFTLLSFGNITTSNTTASIPYSVSGTATSVTIEYSGDNGSTWTTIPVSSLSGGTLSLTGLTPGTTYQLRGRAQNTGAGWSGYTTGTFLTSSTLPVVTVSSVSNITPTEAQVNLLIS